MISDAMKVRLRPGDRAVLEARLRAATTEQRQLLRIRIVLEAAEGHGTREIARELETTPTTVSLWRIRIFLLANVCPPESRDANLLDGFQFPGRRL
jgi:DNA-binding NarL/FixJ family response regulator